MSHDVESARIAYDDVAFDDQLAIVAGKPFTGIVFADHPNGAREAELTYRDGLPDGEQREWYSSGQLECRWIAVRGRGSSEVYRYHPDGTPQSYVRYADQLPVERKEWDADGTLTIDETMTAGASV